MPRVGPSPAFWSPRTPLPNPYLRLFVASPADDRTLYAVAADASQASALFESVDGAASWTALAEIPAGEEIGSLAIDPADPQTLLRTTHRFPAGTTMVDRSPDGGLSWQSSLDPGVYCGPVGFAREGAVALVGCEDRLFRTYDGGATWSSVPNPLGSRPFTPAPDGSILAVGDGIYRTPDDGATWTRVGELPDCSDVNTLAVSPSNPLELLAGAAVPHALGILCGGIFRSENSGLSWVETLDGRDVIQIQFDVSSPTRVIASAAGSGPASDFPYGGVFASDDGGRTWRELESPGLSDLPASIALSASGRTLYTCLFQGSVFVHRFRRPPLLAPR